jgi:REP element-mobilizing transposase RayT
MKRHPTFYRRNLPHWHPPGAAIFVTWRLKGSLPTSAVKRLRETHGLLKQEAERRGLSIEELNLRINKKLFAMLDEFLDRAEYGPTWLREPAIANMIQDALLNTYAHLYKLWAYVIMPNHVHVLVKPKLAIPAADAMTDGSVSLSDITKRLKGYAAREANKLLGLTGQSFWQAESFDHWPRDEYEFYRIIAYIENNPVKAGLVILAEDWPWSSAAERKRRRWKEIRSLT